MSSRDCDAGWVGRTVSVSELRTYATSVTIATITAVRPIAIDLLIGTRFGAEDVARSASMVALLMAME
jgi:hypothetical protein